MEGTFLLASLCTIEGSEADLKGVSVCFSKICG